jgi:hypothetical protein
MSMTQRVKRATQLTMLAGEIVRAAVSKTAKGRRRVSAHMGALHGLPQKIGQMLSLKDFEHADKAFAALTQGRTSLPPERVFEEIERALGEPISRWFESIDREGLSASLGQVHRARLWDGRDVAVKVQYPGIADAVRQDLSMLGVLALPMGGFRRRFDVSGYRREMALRLEEELDYRKEVERMREFTRLTEALPAVRVPQPVYELCGKTVLTATWLENVSLDEAVHWPEPVRRELAGTLLKLFLFSIFRWRVLHADPHAGNYRFALEQGRPVLVLFDFGCVKEVPRAFSREFRRLIALCGDAKRPASSEDLLQVFAALGFRRELLEPMAAKLPALAQVLVEPFLAEGSFSVRDWNLSERFSKLLGDLKWNFRVAGSPDLLYVVRAWQGLLCYLKALRVSVPWRALYEEAVQGLPKFELRPLEEKLLKGRPVKSNKLKIRVCENDQTKVELTFQAQAAEWLHELVPEELKSRLLDRKVDVRALAQAAVTADFPPGTLFEDQRGFKSVRVWLE